MSIKRGKTFLADGMRVDIIGKRVFDTWWVNIWIWFRSKYISDRIKGKQNMEHKSIGYQLIAILFQYSYADILQSDGWVIISDKILS